MPGFLEKFLELRETLSQAVKALVVGLVAAVVGVGGFGFLAAALFLVLTEILEPAGAAAATGGILLVVMGILMLIARSFLRPSPPPPPEKQAPPPVSNEYEALSRVAERLGAEARRRVPLAAGLTFAAGFVLGLKPNARRALWQALVKRL